jgi:hypothetical protein
MKLFIAFLVLCFVAGMTGQPPTLASRTLDRTSSDRRLRWFVAVLAVVLMVGYYVFNRI